MSDGAYEPGAIDILPNEVSSVRRRAAMYVASTGPLGLAHLAFGLVHEALARYRARGVRRVEVSTRTGLVVTDDGEPPTDVEVERWRIWHPPGEDPELHDSRAAIGHLVIIALSSAVVATFDGERRRQRLYLQGVPVTPLTDIGPASGRGTTIAITPDTAIFSAATLPVGMLRARLEELAILHPSVTFVLDGAELPSYGGLAGYAASLAGELATRQVHRREVIDDTTVEVAVAWGHRDQPPIERAWANGLQAEGQHLEGLRRGLVGTERGGRVAVISVVVPFAEYEGRSRRRLRNPGLRKLVVGVVRRALKE